MFLMTVLTIVIFILGYSQLRICSITPPLKKSRLHFLIQIVALYSETNEKSIFCCMRFLFLRYNRSKMGKFLSIWLLKRKITETDFSVHEFFCAILSFRDMVDFVFNSELGSCEKSGRNFCEICRLR